MATDALMAAYLTEAASWDADRAARERRWARLAWFAAVLGWTTAIGLVIALICLVPLKSVEPFVVRLDNTTGVVDVVPTYIGEPRFEEAVTRYLLTRYVRVCEGYAPASAESDYEECGAFNSAERNQALYALWNPSNPDSPLNRFKDGTSVHVQVTSVSFFKRVTGVEDLAQVRYLTATRRGGTGGEQIGHYIATLQYTYGAPSRVARTRAWNPLGLKVISWRREAEVPEVHVAGGVAP